MYFQRTRWFNSPSRLGFIVLNGDMECEQNLASKLFIDKNKWEKEETNETGGWNCGGCLKGKLNRTAPPWVSRTLLIWKFTCAAWHRLLKSIQLIQIFSGADVHLDKYALVVCTETNLTQLPCAELPDAGRISLPKEQRSKLWDKSHKSSSAAYTYKVPSLGSSVESWFYYLLTMYIWLTFVMETNWRGSNCLKYLLSSSEVLEGGMRRQPFLCTFISMWLCSNCICMQCTWSFLISIGPVKPAKSFWISLL